MDLYFDVGLEILGSLVGLSLGLGLILGIVYWQYREFVNWPHIRWTYWLFKLGTPVLFGVGLLITFAIAGTIEGMEALGVFYLGAFLSLALAPVAAAAIAGLVDIAFKDSVSLTVSVVIAVMGLVFGLSMAASSINNLTTLDLESEKRQRAYQLAEENPAPAGDAVTLLNQQLFKMPDGKRLFTIDLAIEPGWRAYKLEQKTPVADKTPRYRSSENYCFEDNVLHLLTLVDKSESVDFRLLWQKEGFDGFILYAPQFEFPASQYDSFFEVFVHQGVYELSVPLPVNQVQMITNDQVTHFTNLKPAPARPAGSPWLLEHRLCTGKTFLFGDIDHLRLSIYSDELRQHMPFRLAPRHVEPEFR